MSEKHLFGTDGIRGIAGEEWLAPDKVEHIGRSIGTMLKRNADALHSSEKPFPGLSGRTGAIDASARLRGDSMVSPATAGDGRGDDGRIRGICCRVTNG